MDYRSRLYETYASTHLGQIRDVSIAALERQQRTFRHYLGRFLPQDRDARILDAGCGYGGFLYYLQSQGYRNAQGVDISPEQVEAAKGLGIPNVSCEDVVVFLQKHGTEFDCIAALDVIEHFPKEEVLPFCDAVYQALRPEGRFIVQAPNGASPFAGTYRYIDFTHSLAFTKESINQVLASAGFTDVQVYPTGPIAHGIMSTGRWVLWQIIRLVLSLYLLVETGVFRGHILTQNLIAFARKSDHAKER